MRVALINTNRFVSPPVIPVGLEYLAGPLEKAGHQVQILDLTFSESPSGDIKSFIQDMDPDVIGFSIRNIDSVLYPDNRFFLEEIADMVKVARDLTQVPAIAGGSACLCSREALRNYLDVDYILYGPGEKALPEKLTAIKNRMIPPGVINGYEAGIDRYFSHERGRFVDFTPYLADKHPAGILFQSGCPWECSYCVERKKPTVHRDIGSVVAESRSLHDAGVESLFFCDSEFNLDLELSKAFLENYIEKGPGLEWTAYFKPAPFDEKLASLLRKSRCTLATLSVNSWELFSESNPHNIGSVKKFIENCSMRGIKVAVDLMIGYPGENKVLIETALDLLANAEPNKIGVNQYFRLYEGLPVMRDLFSETDSVELLGEVENNSDMLRPIFATALDPEWLSLEVMDNKLFFIEGSGRGVNYLRV
ncbi:MAG: cobalamin-dependent protein [Actinobacteria bacterium]|nr:cobalamin-dependent protein [Actinomycetota bacterium]